MSLEKSNFEVRAKILGTALRDARVNKGQSLADCAVFLGIDASRIEAFEEGQELISLPEIEMLSYFLETPIDLLLGTWDPEPVIPKDISGQVPLLMRLRNRLIGGLLRQARLDENKSLEDIATQIDLSPEELEHYELGVASVPYLVLEELCSVLHRSIDEFLDKQGIPGVWNAQQKASRDFKTLPTELQLFISKPGNRPYLELAVRLSKMSVDQLRAVAEGLLEITY